jgi:hypothetical protein
MRGSGRGLGRGGGMGAGSGWGGGGTGARTGWGGRGMGRGQGAMQAPTPAGYGYVGSCRCGFGPNAYYQDAQGQVVPGRALFSGQVQVPEIERLRAEKAELERRLGDLEARLRDAQ